MKSDIVILFSILNLCSDVGSNAWNSSCGWDGSPSEAVYDGLVAIEKYPWMGILYYPLGKRRFTSTVVLVTRQMVIAAASEIDRLPKVDFRAKARVVLGHACGVISEIKVRDYTYHPEYVKDSFSALAMLQLETDHVKTELRPICQPPKHFLEPQFFAMTLTGNCQNPKIRIHRMKYVNINECKNFYRRSGLSQASLWPRHAACARAVSGGRCLWRSGSVLAIKQDGRWRLLGFSVYGPGCGDPARFLDYGKYHPWVRLSSSTVGLPAITRMGDDHLVMRRSLSNIQRFGPCDPEERFTELYTDQVSIFYKPGLYHARYNVSLYASVEYSCITFKARSFTKSDYKKMNMTEQPVDKYFGFVHYRKPKISLRRWCASGRGMCSGFQHIEVQFYVDIMFSQSVEFDVKVYGREAKVISVTAAMKFANVAMGVYPDVPSYDDVSYIVSNVLSNSPYQSWFSG